MKQVFLTTTKLWGWAQKHFGWELGTAPKCPPGLEYTASAIVITAMQASAQQTHAPVVTRSSQKFRNSNTLCKPSINE